MATGLLRIFIVSNILGYVLVNGRPNGAPRAACEDGTNIVPGHVPNLPSTSPIPYSVDISSLLNGYNPGKNYTITLRGSPANRNFRGFMIQGRVRADDSPAGTFGSDNNYQPQCSGNTAATHTARNNKRTVNLVWTAPPANTGFICFRYAFVDVYATYWANLTTPCVSQTFVFSVIGAVLGSKITLFYNVSQSSICTCQMDSDSPVPCDPRHMFTNLTVGDHSVNITCTSQSTGLTLSRTLDFRVEVATSGSAGIVGNTVILILDANANGTYQCSLDEGAFESCRPGTFYTGLSVGQHTIDVRFTPTGSTQVTAFQLQFNIAASGFSVTASAIYSGDKITVSYEASAGAVCTCQLDSGSPVSCDSGHMFNNVPEGEHTVIVRCTSADGLMTASSTVSALQFLNVQLTLESSGTSITVIPETNIEATHRCRLDNGPFVECFVGFQFQGLSGGWHTVTVESTSLNRLTSLNTTGATVIRGSDAILITDIIPSTNIADQIYNFAFNINEKLEDLNITLLIDSSPITVPFDCVCISDEMCYCTFRIANMEYAIGTHTLTFQSILNGEIRGSTSTMFIVTDATLAKFKDIEYSVVEGARIFRVDLKKTGTTAQTVTLSIQFVEGTAMSPSDYPVFQAAQAVVIPPGPSIDIPVNLTIDDDKIVECNETFTLRLVSLDTVRLQIDPAHDQATVTIIDDDVTTVAFTGSAPITEGNTGPFKVTYQGTIAQSFMITVESYQRGGSLYNFAIPGVDYEPVDVRLTFTPTSRSQIINVMTKDDEIFEDDKRICLRLTNLTEPCPGSVILGNDTEVVIAEDEIPVFTLLCYTNTTGNSIVGQNISLFYSSPGSGIFVPEFRCALDGGALVPCADPPPTVYGPLSYGNHTIAVRAQSGVTLEEIIITHQVLMVQARLRAVNSSAIQISIQSTTDATYRCRLNDGQYFHCNDSDVVGDLPPMMYTLMVEATNTTGNNPPQYASDIVGLITLTGGSSGSTCAGSMNLTTPDNLSSYQAEWRSRGDRVVFTLRGEGQGWVGIGFSHNRMMAISDIILGAADASNSFVDDRFAFTRDITVQPPRDPIQNVDNTFASFEDGFTTVRFSRQKETGDTNDFSLNDCVFFLFAWGGAVTDFSIGQIEYHGFNRRFISDSLICLPSSSFCPERVDCGHPGTPINGVVMLFNDTMEDSVAVYSCNFGFRLVGDRERTCQFSRFVDQMWTGAVPTCIRITCGDPGVPVNGSVTSNGTFITSTAEFICDFVFELIGDTQRVCQPDGTWSNMVPECRRITCGDPGRPMNGSVTSNGTFVTSIAEFTCNFVFELIGDTQRVCQLNGNWSNMVPECRPAFKFILQCYTNTTGNSITGWTINLFYSATAALFPVYRCALNMNELQPCNVPSPTMYGPLSYGNYTVIVEAQSAISFEVITITHQVLMVQARLRVVNSSAIQISMQSTKDVTYRCRLNDGSYFPCDNGDVIPDLPPMKYTLMVEATTNDHPPQSASDVVGPITLAGSLAQSCSGAVNLTSLDHLSTYTASWRAQGDRIEFELTGSGQGWVGIGFSHNRMMAQSDIVIGVAEESKFFVDDRFAFTRDITVQPPRDPIQNVDNMFASFEDGFTTVRFSRQKETGDVNDFSLNDCVFFLFAWGGAVTNFNTGQIEYHGFNRRFISDSLECIPTSTSYCAEQPNCGHPGTLENGDVLFDSTLEKSFANFSCNFGFRLYGDAHRICQSNSVWSGTVPTCIPDCGNLQDLDNGQVSFTATLGGSVANYSCDQGFVLCGAESRTCQLNGSWSGSQPECIRTIVTVDETIPYIVYENEGSVNITLLLDQPSCHPIIIIANPQERSPPSATAVDDFNDTSIKVTVNPGEIKAKISVFITDDDLLESVELFDVEILIGNTDTAAAELSHPGIVPITVLNEDIIIAIFTEREYYASEGAGMMRIGVELNRKSPQHIVLQLLVTPITAEGNDVDINSNSRNITFGHGRRTRHLHIPINDDDLMEPVETVRFSIQIPPDFMRIGVRLGFISEATGNIIDDDVITTINTSTGATAHVTIGNISATTATNSASPNVTAVDVSTTAIIVTTFINTPRFEESSDNNNNSSFIVISAIIALLVVVFVIILVVVVGIIIVWKRKKNVQHSKEEECYYSTIDETMLQRISNSKPQPKFNEKQDSKEPQYEYMDISKSNNITEQADKVIMQGNPSYSVQSRNQIKMQDNPARVSSESQAKMEDNLSDSEPQVKMEDNPSDSESQVKMEDNPSDSEPQDNPSDSASSEPQVRVKDNPTYSTIN